MAWSRSFVWTRSGFATSAEQRTGYRLSLYCPSSSTASSLTSSPALLMYGLCTSSKRACSVFLAQQTRAQGEGQQGQDTIQKGGIHRQVRQSAPTLTAWPAQLGAGVKCVKIHARGCLLNGMHEHNSDADLPASAPPTRKAALEDTDLLSAELYGFICCHEGPVNSRGMLTVQHTLRGRKQSACCAFKESTSAK